LLEALGRDYWMVWSVKPLENRMLEYTQRRRLRGRAPSVRRRSVFGVLVGTVLAVATATGQQSIDTVTESVSTQRDVNGRDVAIEKVVTHRARTKDEERVVIDTYIPLIYADRLALNRRVRRVTSRTTDGSRTVEEIEEWNAVAPAEPLRVTRRSETTVRRSGSVADVIEQHVFELDANGRLVAVRSEIGSTSRQ
jgi:hypothetical protein